MKILVDFKFLLILVTGCQAVVLREIISIREERVWVTDDDHGEATVCGLFDLIFWKKKTSLPLLEYLFDLASSASGRSSASSTQRVEDIRIQDGGHVRSPDSRFNLLHQAIPTGITITWDKNQWPHDVDTKSWFFNWSPKNPSPMEQVTFNISMVAPVDFSHGKLQGYVILPGGQKAKLDYLFSCTLLQWKKCPIKKGDKIEAVKATRLPDLILEGKISVYANFYNDSGELALCLNATMSIGMTPPFLL